MKTTTARISHAPSTDLPRPVDSPHWGVAAALALVRAYKLLLSSYFSGSCRFLPSCADYAQEALVRHGLVKGGWLALTRIGRCHPFCEGGHDPVPLRTQGH